MAQRRTTKSSSKKTGSEAAGRSTSSQTKRGALQKKASVGAVRKENKRTAQKKKSFVKTEISSILMIAAGIFFLLADLGLMGTVGGFILSVQRGLFGQGCYIFGVALAIFAVISYLERGKYLRGFKLAGVVTAFAALTSIIHLLFAGRNADGSIESYALSELYGLSAEGLKGGGVLGGIIANTLQFVIGYAGAYLILIVLLVISIVVITEKSFVGAARISAKKTAGAVKFGAGKTVEAAKAGREYYSEHQQRKEELREEKRQRLYEEKQLEDERLKREAEELLKYGREIIGNGQTGVEDLGNVKEPIFGGRPKSRQNIIHTNFDTEVIQGLPDEAWEKQRPVTVKEINYDDDSVPFEEEKEDRYKSYAGIINSGRFSAQAAGMAGFAAGNASEVSANQTPDATERPESFDAFKTERPKIRLSGFDDDSDGNDNDSNDNGGDNNDSDNNAELKAYDDADKSEEATYFSASGKEMESPDAYEAQLIMNKKRAMGENVQASSGTEKESSDEIKKTEEKPKTAPKPKPRPYVYPKASLLERGTRGASDSRQTIMNNAEKLEQLLRDFGVGATVTNVIRGPRVCRYEIIPDTGVKVSRITGLADDIKLALAAAELRIEAPIPGKAAVGIEVPNSSSQTVRFRDILESEEFKAAKSKLAWGVGLDINGKPVIADIAKMPHLLVAGTTGSGKSVGINSLIMSILYRATPDEVRMILVDPKVVELSVYNGIPHLLTEVVTKPERAVSALNWAVSEMNSRYKLFQTSGTRNISGYNEKTERTLAELPPDTPDEDKPKKLPYILIVIDELSELMMHSKKDVESAIVSLTQLARAAGLHLVVATQRPSVDVITGLIKSNIPSRIAYRLPSQTDSRTILDQGGAETLLGNGDMLYKPGDKNSPARVQGAFLSDEEVEEVVKYVRKHNGDNADSTEFDEAINTQMELELSGLGGDSGIQKEQSDKDEYFAEAGRLIINSKKASIGALQRKFKIGFNRAARIMDQLHEAGVVGDSEGTKERQILMDIPAFEEMLKGFDK